MIDRIGEATVQIAQRIIRQRRQMHDRVETQEISRGEIPQIFTDFASQRGEFVEITPGKEICIEPDHVMSRGTEDRTRNSAYVSFMAGQQYFHAAPEKCGIRQTSAW